MFLGAGEWNTPSSFSSDDDPSSLAVDAEGQIARFVTKTLRVCGGLVVLPFFFFFFKLHTKGKGCTK